MSTMLFSFVYWYSKKNGNMHKSENCFKKLGDENLVDNRMLKNKIHTFYV